MTSFLTSSRAPIALGGRYATLFEVQAGRYATPFEVQAGRYR